MSDSSQTVMKPSLCCDE